MEEKVLIKSTIAKRAKIGSLANLVFGAYLLLMILSQELTYEYFSPLVVLLILGWFSLIYGIVILIYIKTVSLQITDKRVCGNIGFGRTINIPIDSISAVSVSAFVSGIKISSSSGVINCWYLGNYKEIYDVLCKLTKLRQNTINSVAAPITTTVAPTSTADELKKYKDLLDSGVITQEEFAAKKKQLLGL